MKQFGIVMLNEDSVEKINNSINTLPLTTILSDRAENLEYFLAMQGLYPEINPVEIENIARTLTEMHLAIAEISMDSEEEPNED